MQSSMRFRSSAFSNEFPDKLISVNHPNNPEKPDKTKLLALKQHTFFRQYNSTNITTFKTVWKLFKKKNP